MHDELGPLPAGTTRQVAPRAPVLLGAVRATGPGRLERGYQARIVELEERARRADRELELAALLERGSARLLDRVEADLARARHDENRLLVALGALQRDTALRAERARALEARLAVLGPAERAPGWLARVFARARRRLP